VGSNPAPSAKKMITKIKTLLKIFLKCNFCHKRIWPGEEWIGMAEGQAHFECYNSWEHGK